MTAAKRKPRKVVVYVVLGASGDPMVVFLKERDAKSWMRWAAGEYVVRCEGVKP